MILTGPEIREARQRGDIVIEPFCEEQVGPNSYDFRLGNRCAVYRDYILDTAKQNRTRRLEIDTNGLLLNPSTLYLVNTLETMGSERFVPIIRGRSSIGRLGIFLVITSDLIDIGSVNQWTLQLHAVQPVRVYPGMLIGQVTFWTVEGCVKHYQGKYGFLQSPVPSLAYLDIRR